MAGRQHGTFWLDFTIGAGFASFALLILQMVGGVYDEPSIERTDDCIIVAESGTVISDPEPGEDDGLVYCPTGELSNSQLGKVVR